MSDYETSSRRVLAIAPKTRGFGFIVMESQHEPLDWGFRTCRKRSIEKEIAILGRVQELFKRYEPSCIILERINTKSRHGDRIRLLLASIRNLAVWARIKPSAVSPRQLERVFRTFRASTKHQIACVVAEQVPELAPLLPAPRKPWLPEDDRLAIFDATALALTHFYTRQNSLQTKPTKPV
jgi:hypothetical protein